MSPRYEIRTRKLVGSPHTRWSLLVGGVEVRAQLHPFSPDQIADALAPAPVYKMRPFGNHAKPRGRPGPKPAGWKPPTEDDMEDAA